MTGSTHPRRAMRHIPEEELHAYLDQGLSRSQCVEIESHLAACPSCQASRDAIAALRDRTTALLAKLAPPRGFPPAFESLRRRAAVQATARRRRTQIAAWAASLIVAVGLGWMANYLLTPEQPRRARWPAVRVAPLPITAPEIPAAAIPAITELHRSRARRWPGESVSVARPRRSPPRTSSSPRLTRLPHYSSPQSTSPIRRPELNGMWRTMSWDGAQAEAGDKLPHIDGLPVVQVQLQLLPTDQGKQPLMVVAQQLSSGEVIRTIEGPTNDVSHLLAQRTVSDPDPTSTRHSARMAPARAVPIAPWPCSEAIGCW